MALAHLSADDDTARPPARTRAVPRAQILIVSGDSLRVAAWQKVLRRKRFSVVRATSEQAARVLLADSTPDVLLIDLADPAVDALVLCRSLRADGITVPVLMVHPLGTPDDQLAGFEAGADDYLRGWVDSDDLTGHLVALCRLPTALHSPEPAPPFS